MACLPPGMPRMMTALFPMEFVFTPAITYILFENVMPRRIYTDGRPWPNFVEPAFAGYSIGKWIDEDGDGTYDVLEIETRNMKNPRTFEASGLPLHKDAQTVVRERIWLENQAQRAVRRGRHHRQRVDAAVDGDQDLSSRIQRVLVRQQLHREQPARPDARKTIF
jgi:hypothetical protein